MILFALSEGWNGSQNAYTSLLGHKLESGVHSPIPLYGPCPQQATFDVTNPAPNPKKKKTSQSMIDCVDLAKCMDRPEMVSVFGPDRF